MHIGGATFENVKVNPYYLTTKGFDKTKLSLSKATLIDDWSYLRKKHSGINLTIVFLLTVIFFLPIVTKAFFMLLTTKVEGILPSVEKTPLWEALYLEAKKGG